MTAPRPLRPPPGPQLLPDIGEEQVPAWAVVRRAVPATLGLFAVLLVALAITASVVTIDRTVDGNGSLEPLSLWAVRPADGGIVADVLVRAGDSVHAGQVVARLDSLSQRGAVADLESQLATARVDLERLVRATPIERERLTAALSSANARVFRARRALQEKMVEYGVTGSPDSVVAASATRVHLGLDGAVADLLGAQADAEGIRSQLSAADLASMEIAQKENAVRRLSGQLVLARERLRRGTLVSPADGVVLTEQLDHMNGAGIGAGQTLLEVADLRSWRAEVNVPESDVHKIHLGDRAIIELPALAARPVDRLDGHVTSIASDHDATMRRGPGDMVPMAGSPLGYTVRIAIDSAELHRLERGVLRRGYAVHGKVITASGTIAAVLLGYVRERTRGFER
jgi:multidrug resistance efflux pump